MWKTLAPIFFALGVIERFIGLAGLPGDLEAWIGFLRVIPDEIFGAAVLGTLLLVWQRWGTRIKDRWEQFRDRGNTVKSNDVKRIKTLTRDEYEALETKDPNTLYLFSANEDQS